KQIPVFPTPPETSPLSNAKKSPGQHGLFPQPDRTLCLFSINQWYGPPQPIHTGLQITSGGWLYNAQNQRSHIGALLPTWLPWRELPLLLPLPVLPHPAVRIC